MKCRAKLKTYHPVDGREVAAGQIIDSGYDFARMFPEKFDSLEKGEGQSEVLEDITAPAPKPSSEDENPAPKASSEDEDPAENTSNDKDVTSEFDVSPDLKGIKIINKGGGWHDVFEGEEQLNEKGLKAKDVPDFLDDLLEEE